MQDTDILTVTCRVKNVGTVAGAEAVQLYVRDEESFVRRPIRELKGFEKVFLAPGEERQVSFRLDKRSFAYYEVQIHDWFVESGRFFIDIGSSSRDIRLSGAVNVYGTQELPVHVTRLTTIGELFRFPRGKAFVEQMLAARSARSQKAVEENNKTMGEGSDKIVKSMMYEMPLGSLVTYGVMSFEQLDGLIASLNRN